MLSIEVKHPFVAIILVCFPFFSTIRVVPDGGVSLYRLLVAFYARFGTITVKNKGSSINSVGGSNLTPN